MHRNKVVVARILACILCSRTSMRLFKIPTKQKLAVFEIAEFEAEIVSIAIQSSSQLLCSIVVL